jgi:hypothetical protein
MGAIRISLLAISVLAASAWTLWPNSLSGPARWSGAAQSPKTKRPQPSEDCVRFSSHGRLQMGKSYVASLPRGLKVRLAEEGAFGWDISVEPAKGSGENYAWVVTPPFGTAPHMRIGPGYNLTARQSVRIERAYRFVLSQEDYHSAVQADRESGDRLFDELERLGKGSLTLQITGFGVRMVNVPEIGRMEALNWIEFRGEACVPR